MIYSESERGPSNEVEKLIAEDRGSLRGIAYYYADSLQYLLQSELEQSHQGHQRWMKAPEIYLEKSEAAKINRSGDCVLLIKVRINGCWMYLSS